MRCLLTLVAGCNFAHGVGGASNGDAAGGGAGDGQMSIPDAAVVADAMATPVDAPPGFDPGMCPSTYTLTIPSSASRYRVRSSDVWWNHEQNCEGDTSGKSHLVVLDSDAEAGQLRQTVSGSFFVGAVQSRNQTLPASGWSWLTGGAVGAGVWELAQPDDADGLESNRENLAIDSGGGTGGLRDFDTVSSSSLQAQGLCECDGKPASPSVASQIPSDPT